MVEKCKSIIKMYVLVVQINITVHEMNHKCNHKREICIDNPVATT